MTTTPPTGPPARRTGSHTSLTNLTLASLSTDRPLIETDEISEHHSPHTYATSPPRRRSSFSPAPTAPAQYTYRHHLARPSSYIAARSVPTTPGILSRSHSPTRSELTENNKGALSGSKSFTQLAVDINTASGAATPSGIGPKSAGLVDVGVIGTSRRQRERARLRQSRESAEWLYRHGAALADEARSAKGQGWLVNRASSTSVAEEGVNQHASANKGRSRQQSARTSRVNLARLGMTTAASTRSAGTPLNAIEGVDYFGEGGRGVEGPDFVNGVEDEEGEDEVLEDDAQAEEEQERLMEDAEVARLAKRSSDGLGLSGFVDRLIGWTLFDVGSDRTQRAEEEEEMRVELQTRLKRVKDSQRELAQLVKAEHVRMGRERVDNEREEGAAKTEGKAWSDAAWLLGVASRAIL